MIANTHPPSVDGLIQKHWAFFTTFKHSSEPALQAFEAMWKMPCWMHHTNFLDSQDVDLNNCMWWICNWNMRLVTMHWSMCSCFVVGGKCQCSEMMDLHTSCLQSKLNQFCKCKFLFCVHRKSPITTSCQWTLSNVWKESDWFCVSIECAQSASLNGKTPNLIEVIQCDAASQQTLTFWMLSSKFTSNRMFLTNGVINWNCVDWIYMMWLNWKLLHGIWNKIFEWHDVLIINACQTVGQLVACHLPLIEQHQEVWKYADDGHKHSLHGCCKSDMVCHWLVNLHHDGNLNKQHKADASANWSGWQKSENVNCPNLEHSTA